MYLELKLTSTVAIICSPQFLFDVSVTRHFQSMVITHRFYYLTFHAVVIVTWHIHVQSLPITLRFRYSAFASPVQTMYSTVRLLGVSWLPLRFATSCKVMQHFLANLPEAGDRGDGTSTARVVVVVVTR